jgi:DNA-binding response OmpR family regulator
LAVDIAADGAEALLKARVTRYDVVILDRDLPEVHGDDVCRALTTERPETRVLMLTAAGGVEDRVEGLALGADDYLAKPFAFAELVARVRALGRRAGPARPPVLERNGITLDPARHEVHRDGELIALSPKEHIVLEVLMEADGAVVSPEELLERAWDEQVDPLTNSVRMVVMTLRRKLGEPQAIVTVPGAGYRL